MSYLLCFLITFCFLNSNTIFKGDFLFEIKNVVLFSSCVDCTGEYPSYDIFMYNVNENKVDTVLKNVINYDFQKIDDSTFIYTDGYSIWSYNSKKMSKTLLYKNRNICDLLIRSNIIYFFKSLYDPNKMLLYQLNNKTATLISSFNFSEYEYHGLKSFVVNENIFFTIGQELYWMDSINTLENVESRVYELFVNKEEIFYGYYDVFGKFQYKVLNINNKNIKEYIFPTLFNKKSWRDPELLCLNNSIYYFYNGKIYTYFENSEWKEILSVPLFQNQFYRGILNSSKEIVMEEVGGR